MRELRIPFPPLRRGNKAALLLIGAIWIVLASMVEYVDAAPSIFGALVGTDSILRGEVWRLVTSFVVHNPAGLGSAFHPIGTAAGLYFLGTSLEEQWGTKRYLLFLLFAGVFAATLQVLLGAVIPWVHAPIFYGGIGVVDAVAVAWALSFRDRQVNLFFAFPVTARSMIFFILCINILFGVVLGARYEGLVTPFAGMLAGWMGADGSPVRKLYLQWRFKRLQSQSEALRGVKAQRVPHLRVVKGGASGPESKPKKEMLN
ncbi:MAG: rhomboid family intramembrane serine protease [Polyangiaceae bacterium]|nr:rhomboid family intramembrane serine protease [Polyangiaceae bacterium]